MLLSPQESQSPTGIESGEGRGGQHGGLLQVHQQQKENQGKSASTWARGQGVKRHGKG